MRKQGENRMLCDRSQMERRVRQRTREFQKANTKLLEEIKKRSKVEQALRQSDEQNRNLLDSLPISLAVYDLRDHLLFLNAAFTKTFGWTREELIIHKVGFVPQECLA